MADLNKIVDLISECSVVEVSELVKMLEEKFGVSAAAPVMVAGPAQGAEEAAAKTEFNVVLKDAGASKIKKANELGITKFTEEEYLNLINN